MSAGCRRPGPQPVCPPALPCCRRRVGASAAGALPPASRRPPRRRGPPPAAPAAACSACRWDLLGFGWRMEGGGGCLPGLPKAALRCVGQSASSPSHLALPPPPPLPCADRQPGRERGADHQGRAQRQGHGRHRRLGCAAAVSAPALPPAPSLPGAWLHALLPACSSPYRRCLLALPLAFLAPLQAMRASRRWPAASGARRRAAAAAPWTPSLAGWTCSAAATPLAASPTPAHERLGGPPTGGGGGRHRGTSPAAEQRMMGEEGRAAGDREDCHSFQMYHRHGRICTAEIMRGSRGGM